MSKLCHLLSFAGTFLSVDVEEREAELTNLCHTQW